MSEFSHKADNKAPVRIASADYQPSSLVIYQGNLLIEALPDYLTYSIKSIYELLDKNMPDINPQAVRLQKDHWLMSMTTDCFITLPRHIELQELIDLLIRQGYHRRSPLNTSEYVKLLNTAGERTALAEAQLKVQKSSYTDALSASVIGISGCGKTYSITRCLDRLYPQVIKHDSLPEILGLNFTQLVYVKVECPSNGSVKSLCCAIISEIDRLTGEEYYDLYVKNGRTTIEILKTRLSHLLALYNVGLLVIDEIQNLTAAKNNRDNLFNFVVSLSNGLSVSLLFIGTTQAQKLIQSDLRVARRFGSCGFLKWDRLKRDSEYGLQEWKVFINTLWKYNVLPCERGKYPPSEIEEALYQYSQGIPDILVRLFVLSQKKALIYDAPDLDVEIIDSTFNAYFGNVKPMIAALASGDEKEIAKYQDIVFDDEEYKAICRQLTEELRRAVENGPDDTAYNTNTAAARVLSSLTANGVKLTPVVEQAVKEILEENRLQNIDESALLLKIIFRLNKIHGSPLSENVKAGADNQMEQPKNKIRDEKAVADEDFSDGGGI